MALNGKTASFTHTLVCVCFLWCEAIIIILVLIKQETWILNQRYIKTGDDTRQTTQNFYIKKKYSWQSADLLFFSIQYIIRYSSPFLSYPVNMSHAVYI